MSIILTLILLPSLGCEVATALEKRRMIEMTHHRRGSPRFYPVLFFYFLKKKKYWEDYVEEYALIIY